jgi:hypothetical protein
MVGTLDEDQYPALTLSHPILLRMRNISTEVVEKIETHILSSITFVSIIVPFMRKCGEKNGRVGQATDDNMVHMQCMLDS